MKGMREAISRIQQAIGGRERILIYGDYDVDGTTAIVILKRAIEILGGTAGFHVPHRVRDGYGMKDDVIERAAAEVRRGSGSQFDPAVIAAFDALDPLLLASDPVPELAAQA